MSTQPLTDNRACLNFFQQQILNHLHHWHKHEAVHNLDIAVLDRRRDAILRTITFGLDLPDAWETLRDLVIAFSPYMERRGFWEVWNQTLGRTIEVARYRRDLDGEITLSALFARLLKRQSRLSQAISYHRYVIRLARQTGNQYEEARACSNLGYLYIDEEKWWRSEVLSCYALRIFKKLESRHGCAHTHNHLGLLYTRQHMWIQAEQHLQQACSLWHDMKDAYNLINGFMNLGLLYIDREDLIQALNYLEKGLEQAKNLGTQLEIGKIYNNMGLAHIRNADYERAELCLQKAEKLFRQISNTLELAKTWHNLGRTYQAQHQWQTAIRYLESSLGINRRLNNKEEEVSVLLDMLECKLAGGELLQAIVLLHEVEQLVSTQSIREDQWNSLQNRLEEYRYSLVEPQSAKL